MENIIKMKIPLGSIPVSYIQKETYHENQQNEIFKIKDVQNISAANPRGMGDTSPPQYLTPIPPIIEF